MNDDRPRAYTAAEVRDMLIDHIKATVAYWANLPDVDNATGKKMTVLSRCDGVAFSILSALDGASMSLPGFALRPTPHPEDKAFRVAGGENWFDADTEIQDVLHEHYTMKRPVST